VSEPFIRTLTRSTLAAAGLGVLLLLVLPRHGALVSDFVDAFTLAFCFTLLAPYIDAILRGLPGIGEGIGPLVRFVGWFAGGLWCYVIARWLWIQYGRDLADLPGLVWGGVLLVVLQLVVPRVASRKP
jgi:hypothetical protein